jgi:hypothetical protein
VTPTGETHLSFELRAPRGGSRPGGSEQSSGGSGGRGIGDLKIPDFARNQ